MISKLHYITQDIPGIPHWELAEQACQGGINWVQLRIKHKSYQDCKVIAAKTQKVCQKYDAIFIINDHVHLAKEVNADGVHLGKLDMPPQNARKLLGANVIIGGTANTLEDIVHLQDAGVDYIGLGPFRFTKTKKNLSPILGLKGYRDILRQCRESSIDLPIIAVGGIEKADIPRLLDSGIDGIAISSAVSRAKNISQSAKMLQKYISNHNQSIGV